MKALLEQEDIEKIAQAVCEMLKPMLSNGKVENADEIFDIKGLADYLKVSKQWIYERTHLKEIPYLKINGQLRFRKKDIDKWLTAYNIPATTISRTKQKR